MNSQRLESIIADYIRHNLSPTAEERELVAERYEQLQNILEGQSFQIGSYARAPSTTPVNDLDVIYVVPSSISKAIAEKRIKPEELDISDIIGSLALALRKEYPRTVEIREQPHSVGIFFGSKDEFSIDVVPAIPQVDGIYLVPEAVHMTIIKRRKYYESSPMIAWIKSDPKGYIGQARLVDEQSKGRFRKTVKFIKKWKAGCKSKDAAFPLKSFHLEILITELYKEDYGSSIVEAISRFFNDLPDDIRQPRLPDKADSTRFIDKYLAELSQVERELILELQREAKSILSEMIEAEFEAQVIQAIERLLGEATYGSLAFVGGPRSVEKAYSKPYCAMPDGNSQG